MSGFAGRLDLSGCGNKRGQIWADARLDGRRELVGKFDPADRQDLAWQSDAALILQAYRRWGDKCVEHLLGDFCFALWDDVQRRLFCARDQFGVKPFFYAATSQALVFSNRLDEVQSLAGSSGALNDLAIADFLLFGRNLDPATTAFADIQRLPAGHTLTWHSGTLQVHRYWTLPVNEPLLYQRSSDYVDRFQELLQQAVADRTDSERTGLLMSGGLDSTLVAAAARRTQSDLKAFTIVYDHLIPDEERHYSQIAATALKIPIRYLAADDYELYQRQEELHTPEPVDEPLRAIFVDHLRQTSEFSAVALTGQGGDAVFFPSPDLATQMLQQGRIRELGGSAWKYMRLRRRVPPLGFRGALRKSLGPRRSIASEYPTWLNPELETELGLQERWVEQQAEHPASPHWYRPQAYNVLTDAFWPGLIETYDPGFTKVPIEIRHPLFDLRLVNYCLSVPPIPWFIDKTLPRVAMQGWLPDAVRLRPKTPAGGDPIAVRLREGLRTNYCKAVVSLERFLDPTRVPHLTGGSSTAVGPNLRPISLGYWLKHLTKTSGRSTKETDEIGESFT